MELPVGAPLTPMLAKLRATLPTGAQLYEPKWDGFRCVVFRDGDEVELYSRNQRPFARYFPELVEPFRALPASRWVIDGEIVVVTEAGFDFDALLKRIHPAATHVERMRAVSPAAFVAFDILALGDEDLRPCGFGERRRRLEGALAGKEPPLFLTPVTDDPAVAERWLERFVGGGIDGVVAKGVDEPYQEGKRVMVKVKRERTVDCVVAGIRVVQGDGAVASLLLGLFDDDGDLRHVGVASSFSENRRRELVGEVAPYLVALEGHSWEHGFALEGGSMGRLKGAAGRWTPDMERDWLPLAPELVCEVGYTQLDRRRFRHPARFLRWRPDRDARSCTTDQLDAGSDLPGAPALLEAAG